MSSWAKRLEDEINTITGEMARVFDPAEASRREAYLRANVDSVKQLLRGIGPDDTRPSEGAGARIVFNMACKHVPALCGLDAYGRRATYKNAYELGKAGARRQLVDTAVELACRPYHSHMAKEKMYFAAVETSGTGIRFYGDFCLVIRFRPIWRTGDGDLSSQALSVDESTVVLDRNSYDLARAPLAQAINAARDPAAERALVAATCAGSWARDLLDMVALRVLRALPTDARRWTSGQIARAVLDDEDYVEVLFPRSFDASEILEVRTTASDAAAEADIADRERSGESPALHALEWRQQRREARRALARAGISARVVTTGGRLKEG
jgi:hypothetical protein